MKAAVYREHSKDPTQVVRIEDIDTPKPKANEVLIKVEAASYNYNDLWGIWGEPIKIPAKRVCKFRLAKSLKDTVLGKK